MKYNKLIRDRIPEILKYKGVESVTSIASEEKYWELHLAKLLEEVEEFIESENVEELADIQEVLKAIQKHKKIPQDDVEKIRAKKSKERGAFNNRIVLHETKE